MSDPATINYQPLQAMKGAYSRVITDSLHGGLPLIILIWFVAAEVVLIAYHGLPLTIYPFFGYLLYLGVRVNKFKNNVWQAFANANGWALDTTTPTDDLVPPSLQFGHSPEYSPVIKAQLGNLSSDLLTYNCTTGGGKSSTTHYFTLARVNLPTSMPHMILRSKRNEADTEDDLQNAESLNLEGNFNNYFRLQIEKGQEVDALTIITPDIMQTLISYNQGEDIELLNNQLYFIIRNDKRDPTSVRQLIQSVTELADQLIQNAQLSGGAAATATSNQVILPTIQPRLTAVSWSWARLFQKPTRAEAWVIGLVVLFLLGLFTWVFIGLSNMPQY